MENTTTTNHTSAQTDGTVIAARQSSAASNVFYSKPWKRPTASPSVVDHPRHEATPAPLKQVIFVTSSKGSGPFGPKLKKVDERVSFIGEVTAFSTEPLEKYWELRDLIASGLLHREDGPALTDEDNQFSYGFEMWFENGRLHRLDGPAVHLPSSATKREINMWFSRGQLHRVGAPAITDGEVNEQWRLNGGLHRDGTDPAVTEGFVSSGKRFVLKEVWAKNGKIERGELPAVVEYTTNNDSEGNPVVNCERFYQDGQLHNVDGGAIVYFCDNWGNPKKTQYRYLEGRYIKSKNWARELKAYKAAKAGVVAP